MTKWRTPTEEELERLQQSLLRGVPDAYRHTVDRITCNMKDKNYALMFYRDHNEWYVTEVDPIAITEDYWCPTGLHTTMCPGPCPDGTEHTRIK